MDLLQVNKKLVVINISGTGVAMPWKNHVSTILQAWYLGSETGNALASILMGDVNPSGKLHIPIMLVLINVVLTNWANIQDIKEWMY